MAHLKIFEYWHKIKGKDKPVKDQIIVRDNVFYHRHYTSYKGIPTYSKWEIIDSLAIYTKHNRSWIVYKSHKFYQNLYDTDVYKLPKIKTQQIV